MEEATPTPTIEKEGASSSEKVMNVLVAVDYSEESFHALRWVLDKILKRPRHASAEAEMDSNSTMVVTVAHVVEPLPRYVFPGGHVVESASRSQQQNAARILSRAFEMCRESSVKAKTIILEGESKDMICRTVEEMNINLLVIGSRGLGQIKRAFLGSVSDYCSHHAKCPVLVVKQPPKKTYNFDVNLSTPNK